MGRSCGDTIGTTFTEGEVRGSGGLRSWDLSFAYAM